MDFGVAEPYNMSFVPMQSATTCILVASDLLSRRRSSSILMPLKPLSTQSSATSCACSRLVIESPKQRLPNVLAGISKQNFLAGDCNLGSSFDVSFPVKVPQSHAWCPLQLPLPLNPYFLRKLSALID